MKINKVNYILNGLLDKGLYLTGKKQLYHFVGIYSKENKIEFKEALDSLIDNVDLFLKWIKDKYGVNAL